MASKSRWFSRCTIMRDDGTDFVWQNNTHRLKAHAKAAADDYEKHGYTAISIGRVGSPECEQEA
jgi:hypothetical protein